MERTGLQIGTDTPTKQQEERITRVSIELDELGGFMVVFDRWSDNREYTSVSEASMDRINSLMPDKYNSPLKPPGIVEVGFTGRDYHREYMWITMEVK